jgi:hypothetical protein
MWDASLVFVILNVVAHQGGWDEFLLFAGPIALAYLLIRTVEKRSKQRQEDESHDESGSQNKAS